jgi:DivIVA domain-containing protein
MRDTRLTDTILRKKFNTKALGYCAEEVDAFLDEINIEIEKLEREIECQDETFVLTLRLVDEQVRRIEITNR